MIRNHRSKDGFVIGNHFLTWTAASCETIFTPLDMAEMCATAANHSLGFASYFGLQIEINRFRW